MRLVMVEVRRWASRRALVSGAVWAWRLMIFFEMVFMSGNGLGRWKIGERFY